MTMTMSPATSIAFDHKHFGQYDSVGVQTIVLTIDDEEMPIVISAAATTAESGTVQITATRIEQLQRIQRSNHNRWHYRWGRLYNLGAITITAEPVDPSICPSQ